MITQELTRYFYFGTFLFLTFFAFYEKSYIFAIILFMISDIVLFVSKNNISGYFYISICYFVLSKIIDCFRIKYYLPFLSSLLINKKHLFFIFLNMFFLVDFNLYSLIFAFVNIVFSFKERKTDKIFLSSHYAYLFILLFEQLNLELKNMILYFILLVPMIFVLLINRKKIFHLLNIIIIYVLFSLVYYCRFFYNTNIKNEFNHEGLLITLSNYTILLT